MSHSVDNIRENSAPQTVVSDRRGKTFEGGEWEVLAMGYQALSGKAYHMSDCATCCAPAYKPSQCDCAAPDEPNLLGALQLIADYENDMLNGHEKLEVVQDKARAAIANEVTL